jgi:hypothetical protein
MDTAFRAESLVEEVESAKSRDNQGCTVDKRKGYRCVEPAVDDEVEGDESDPHEHAPRANGRDGDGELPSPCADFDDYRLTGATAPA